MRIVAPVIAGLISAATPFAAFAQPDQQMAISALDVADGAPVCRGSEGYAADFGGRKTYLWRPQWLEAIAQQAEKSGSFKSGIIRAAEAAMTGPGFSVTDKLRIPPGATAHDYASIGPYWWPDPKKPDGLPYYRRDGDANPERDGPEFDKARTTQLSGSLRSLAIAYFITEERRYAERGAELVRRWFLDPATRMNPNLDFAQGIPGKVNGRGEGIIEASHFSRVIEAVGVMQPAGAMTDDEHAALRQWYAEFARWMATSDNGIFEMQKSNNHGVFYDYYLSHFSLYAGMDGVAQSVVDAFPAYRIGVQMDRQGRFIEELERTRSWHYAHYVIEGANRLATVAECVDRDLWNYRLPDGRGLADAHEFLARYRGKETKWPFPDRDHAAGKFSKMESRAASVDWLTLRGTLPADRPEKARDWLP